MSDMLRDSLSDVERAEQRILDALRSLPSRDSSVIATLDHQRGIISDLQGKLVACAKEAGHYREALLTIQAACDLTAVGILVEEGLSPTSAHDNLRNLAVHLATGALNFPVQGIPKRSGTTRKRKS